MPRQPWRSCGGGGLRKFSFLNKKLCDIFIHVIIRGRSMIILVHDRHLRQASEQNKTKKQSQRRSRRLCAWKEIGIYFFFASAAQILWNKLRDKLRAETDTSSVMAALTKKEERERERKNMSRHQAPVYTLLKPKRH